MLAAGKWPHGLTNAVYAWTGPCEVLKRLRGVAADLADLQQDVYDEDWQNLAIYPNLLQAYLPAACFSQPMGPATVAFCRSSEMS